MSTARGVGRRRLAGTPRPFIPRAVRPVFTLVQTHKVQVRCFCTGSAVGGPGRLIECQSNVAPCAKASRSFWPEGPGLRSVERSIAARLRAGDSGTGRSPPAKLLTLLVADTLAGSSCSRGTAGSQREKAAVHTTSRDIDTPAMLLAQ
jgi:hypothetical protein